MRASLNAVGSAAHPSGLRTSLRLYGLIRVLGSSDIPSLASAEVLCTPCGSGSAIRAFVSRLDAELVARSMPASGYRTIPLAQFDPTEFIQAHQGWLSIFLCCGLSSQRGSLTMPNGSLPSLGWFIHAQTGPWASGRFLNWGEEVTQTLLNAYQNVDMPNYNAWLNQLDSYSDYAMENCTQLAWRALKECYVPLENHHAMYNPLDESWKLSTFPLNSLQ